MDRPTWCTWKWVVMAGWERRGRRVGAWTLALAAAAGITVSAGQALGGSMPSVPSLGAASGSVVSCSTRAISVSLDVDYAASLRGYGVVGAHLSGIPAVCEGSSLRVAFSDPQGARLAEVVAVATSQSTAVALPGGQSLQVADVADVAVVVEG